MQLHRSRPEPRLSTFERYWLGGATGVPLAQQPGDTRDLFALRSPTGKPGCNCLSAAGDRGWQARTAPTETDCVAGHVRFELRNVVANYPFEKSRRFAGNQPNSGHGDHSRLSWAPVIRSSGPAASIPRP